MKNYIKYYLLFYLFQLSIVSLAQKTAQEFGYSHLKMPYENDTVHILIKSKKGEESIKKPIFFEVQGSLAVPLIVHNGTRLTSLVSLSDGFIEEDFHLVMVNKPGIPLIYHRDSLDKGRYKDPITKLYPSEYRKKNNLDYYVKRNNAVLNFVKQQSWADTTKIVIAGHSEGSSIVAHMADKITGITHLIYSGGLPYYSRILAMVQQDRRTETIEPNPWVQEAFDYWQDVVDYPFALDRKQGWNTNYGTFSFSQNENDALKRLQIPILICYGTKDEAAPFNDMLHIEVIKDKHTNFTFNAYVGLDHYYQKAPTGENNKKVDHLSKVVNDWLQWIDDN